jgi:hypothetical protein
MIRIVNYAGRFQSATGRVSTLPSWAKLLLGIAALPGLILLGLSIVAFVVSLLALLLLTAPLYRVLTAVTSGGSVSSPEAQRGAEDSIADAPSPGRRHVDVKVIESPQS